MNLRGLPKTTSKT